MESLISVIVPIYNAEQYVAECIESIIRQTYSNLEIILVDDGSTDGSGEICDAYRERDSRIRVIHKANEGVVIARKLGIESARGEYVGFVDSDDYIAADYYEKLYDCLLCTGADMCHTCNVKAVQGKTMFTYGKVWKKEMILVTAAEEFLRDYVLEIGDGKILPAMWAKLFKRSVIDSSFRRIPKTQSIGEDFLCLYESSFYVKSVSVIDDACYYYRMRDGSLTNSKNYLYGVVSLCRRLEEKLNADGLYETLKKEYEQYVRFALASGINEWGDYLFHIPTYALADLERLSNKKVILYGAGNVGRDLYCQLALSGKCEIVAWVDKNSEQMQYKQWRKIEGIEVIKKRKFDYIIIGTVREDIYQSMMNTVLQLGVKQAETCDISIIQSVGI